MSEEKVLEVPQIIHPQLNSKRRIDQHEKTIDIVDSEPKVEKDNLKPPQTAEELITSGICEFCNIHIISVYHAECHITNVPHLEKCKFCVICSRSIDWEVSASIHKVSAEHLRNVQKSHQCFLCRIKLSPGSNMSRHLSGPVHAKKIKDFDKMLTRKKMTDLELLIDENDDSPIFLPYAASFYPLELKQQISANICKLCNVKTINENEIRTHYGGEKHARRVNKWLLPPDKSDISQNPKKKAETGVGAKVGNPWKDGTKEDAKPEITQNWTTYYFCNICKDNYILGDNHFQSEIHNEMINFMKLLSTKGIENSHQDHIKKEYLKCISIRHCDCCQLIFDSSTNLANHFQSSSHVDHVLRFVEERKLNMIQDPFAVGPTHSYSDISRNITPQIPVTPNAIGNRNNKSTISSKDNSLNVQINHGLSNPSTDCMDVDSYIENIQNDLEQKVLSELQTLAHDIYYSNEVPLEKALAILKRFNNEIKEFKNSLDANAIQKADKNDIIEPSSLENSTNLVGVRNSTKNLTQSASESNIKDLNVIREEGNFKEIPESKNKRKSFVPKNDLEKEEYVESSKRAKKIS